MKCITTSALYSLAMTMNRLRAWHESMGGAGVDEPCLREIRYDPIRQRVTAKVLTGHVHYDMVYKNEEWMPLSGDALKD